MQQSLLYLDWPPWGTQDKIDPILFVLGHPSKPGQVGMTICAVNEPF